MPKSPLERQIEKQMQQAKQLAERQRRDEQKRAREEQQAQREAAIRERAASVVSGQPLVAGFRIMDTTAEIMLKCLLDYCPSETNRITFSDEIFPEELQWSTSIELEKLVQYGMIGGLLSWVGGGMLTLLPPAHCYFEEKNKALLRREEQNKMATGNITNYGNIVFGNVSGSTLSVDNSIKQLEREIEEKGGEDKELLRELMEEVKELVENIESSRTIPKQKKLFQRLNDHVVRHGWFYGGVIQLLGTAVMNGLGG
ncbi:MAG: hypothetical protein PUD16_05915 [bacterium]|nr:hypothetical protein [bacterium]